MTHLSENLLKTAKKLHFIGIGGSGMYPIVEILHSEGYRITGSDNNPGDNIDREREMGIEVYMGHAASQVGDADLVIYSAAIHEDNLERQEAVRRGIPAIERSEILGLLSKRYDRCIGVAGTHGKTSTSAMLTQMLLAGNYDPSSVIGGKLPAIGGSGRAGKSDYMVVEACEYANTFLQLSPHVGLILNIDADHLEFFGDFAHIVEAFVTYANQSDIVVANGDDPGVQQALPAIQKPVVTFGWSETNHFYPANIEEKGPFHTEFDLCHAGAGLCRYTIRVAGRHNLINAVAALAAAITAGAKPGDLIAGLEAFGGAGRRFELVGRVNDITVVDDYAHHPAELTVTLNTAKTLGFERVVAVHQPFTFSRTAMLLDDFAEALKLADLTVLSPIMGGREDNTYGIASEDLAHKVPGSVCLPSFEAMADYLAEHARPGDLLITMGCGDVYKCARMTVDSLKTTYGTPI